MKLNQMPVNRAMHLKNAACIYCGVKLGEETDSKEYVIGRNFVPRGKLDGQWNLIVRACQECNRFKANLEDDISAISMHPNASGIHVCDDEVLISEAERKTRNSISRRTGRIVKDSIERISIEGALMPGIKATFDLVAPPQVDNQRVFALSRFQLTAFFYWVTYKSTGVGSCWPGEFFPVLCAGRGDWGNLIHRTFMGMVVNWQPIVLAVGANGYFKITVRRHPSAVYWSWALEWNQNYRVVGFFGEQEPAKRLVGSLPTLEKITVAQGPGCRIAYRKEVALKNEEDQMFH